MKKLIYSLSLSLLVCFFVHDLQAVNIYVTPIGAGNADGTSWANARPGDPGKALVHIVNKSNPMDTIQVTVSSLFNTSAAKLIRGSVIESSTFSTEKRFNKKSSDTTDSPSTRSSVAGNSTVFLLASLTLIVGFVNRSRMKV